MNQDQLSIYIYYITIYLYIYIAIKFKHFTSELRHPPGATCANTAFKDRRSSIYIYQTISDYIYFSQ